MNRKPFFKRVLQIAALYNIAWGLWVGLFPFMLFDFAGLERPNYPEIWQCVGMIVGVYGVGYWIASYDTRRHWPIVLVGLLGKIFGPIGFAWALSRGVYSAKFGTTLLTNDLIWWVPFTLILKDALVPLLNPTLGAAMSEEAIRANPSFSPLFSERWFVLCVRHSGCTFCREELELFSKFETRLKDLGYKIAIVHMGSPESGEEMKSRFGLKDSVMIADPGQHLYRLFALPRGKWEELFGPRNWIRGLRAGILKGHGVGALEGDGRQLGGVALLEEGRVRVLHRATYAGDIGDFAALQMRISAGGD